MVHLAIDGMWQVFKLQRSTPINDFCSIAAKNGILLRLINTLYSLNEATRVVGSGQNETRLSCVDQQDLRYGIIDHQMEPSRASTSHLRKSDLDDDMAQLSEKSSRDSSVDPQFASNGSSMSGTTQEEQVRPPRLSVLEKEPPSRRYSGQLEYVRQLSGLERRESVLPLFQSSDKKPDGELESLMAEFTDVAQRGRENGNLDSSARLSFKAVPKRLGSLASNDVAASTSGIALNARQGDETCHTADVAREYLEKVADLLLQFARADTTVKSYMCSQSLLSRLFQMFNRVQPPILLKKQ